MTSPQNVNTSTVAPIIINPEVILVDSEDLEQIQQEAVAEQRQIEEEAQARLVAARECNEKKRQEQKVKEWKWKEEEDKAIREKSLEEAHKWQLLVSCLTSFV